MVTRQVSASTQRGRSPSPLRLAKLREVRTSEGIRTQPGTGLSSAGDASRDQAQPSTSNKTSLKRKRGQEASSLSLPAQVSLPSKGPQTSTRHTAKGLPQEIEKQTSTIVDSPLQSWVLNKTWPPGYFEPDDQAREALLEHDSWLEEIMAQPPIPVVQYVEVNGFRYPLPVKKAPASLRRKQSDSSLTGSSGKSRESKSTPYRDLRYPSLLATKGSYMGKSDLGITKTSLSSYETLLSSDQTIPTDSLFRDDVFETTCLSVQDRNEARIVSSISPYIVPSAEHLAIMGANKLKCLIENVNEGWIGSIPVEGPRPQPDYSVGFRRSAFTEEQLNRLDPLIGSVFDTSFFVATWRMYFPFLTCEVKCGAAALDVADRQNAHSMTIAVRSIVELYRAVKREKELHREILAFSISHDHRSVRIYGHYPIIDGDKVTYYRHPIREFIFIEMDGREKWTAYKFTKNVYDIWMPIHLNRICSAIEQLPSGLNFQVSEGSEVQSEAATGLSQDMESLLSDPVHSGPVSQEADELNPIPQTATPDTSVSQRVGQGLAKGAKKPRITKEPTARRKNDGSSSK